MIELNHKFKFKSIKNKNIVFTLTPTSIVGSIVTLVKGEKPKVIFSAAEKLIHEEKVNDKNFTEKYLSILNKICLKIIYKIDNDNDDSAFLDSAFIFISDPWLKSSIINMIDEKITFFSVDEKYLEKIEKIKEDDKGYEYKSYISAKANGYDIDFLKFISNIDENKKIKKLEINILEEKTQEDFIKAIRYVIEKNFVLSDIIFKSQFSSIIDASTMIFPNKRDKIVIIAHEEFTLMQVFIDSKLDSITKIPLGTNKVIKKIKEVAMLKDYNHAVEIFDKAKNNETFSGDVIVKKIIDEYKREYIYYLNKSLSNYKKYQISPNVLVISSDKRSILMNDENIFGSNVKKIDYNFIANYVHFSNIKYMDTYTALNIIYLF